MKRLVVVLGLLGVGIGCANGCADDNRPVVGIEPDGNAGETSQGGDHAADGGGSARAGASSAGSLNQGGAPADGGAAPSSSGADPGGASVGGSS